VHGVLDLTPTDLLPRQAEAGFGLGPVDDVRHLHRLNALCCIERRKTFPNHYIRLTAFDATQGVESVQMSYIVNRPKTEPGFGLTRQEIGGRQIQYTVHSYATDKPEGERY